MLLTRFILLLQLTVSTVVMAGDFSWLESLSFEAKKNESNYRTRLAIRFNLGDVKIKAVIGDSGGYSEAYMVLRLAELSHQNVNTVINKSTSHLIIK